MLMISEKDDKKERSVRSGDEAEIVLFENAGAGYRWTITATPGIAIREDRYEPGGRAVGSGGHRHWLIRFTEPGRQHVQCLYRRPWEKPSGGTGFSVTFLVS